MKHIIIITESTPGCEVDWKKPFETWGSLTEACRVHGWSYNYLKRMKFPFTYLGLTFIKTQHKKKVINTVDKRYIKKTCKGCKAYKEGVCALKFKNELTTIKNEFIHIPSEDCPKPKSNKMLVDLLLNHKPK